MKLRSYLRDLDRKALVSTCFALATAGVINQLVDS